MMGSSLVILVFSLSASSLECRVLQGQRRHPAQSLSRQSTTRSPSEQPTTRSPSGQSTMKGPSLRSTMERPSTESTSLGLSKKFTESGPPENSTTRGPFPHHSPASGPSAVVSILILMAAFALCSLGIQWAQDNFEKSGLLETSDDSTNSKTKSHSKAVSPKSAGATPGAQLTVDATEIANQTRTVKTSLT